MSIVRPLKSNFDSANPHKYGKFMVEACTLNNCLSYLKGDYFVLEEDEALQMLNDLHDIELGNLSDDAKEASNKARMDPSNGQTPFATPSKDKLLSNAQKRIAQRFEGHDEARLKDTVGKASMAYALAAVKRAESMTRIFVNKKTLKCETHQERVFHMELYAFLVDGLPKQLLQRVVVGDICALYLKIMGLGQTNAAATRRKLNNQMNNLQKGSNSWPNYLQEFYDISDAQQASGITPEETDLLGCLINGMVLDARYKDAIKEIECARTPLSLEEAIAVITAHATHCRDDQILPSKSERALNAEPNATSSSKAFCRNFRAGKACASEPCPYEHSNDSNTSGTNPRGASPMNAEQARQKSRGSKSKKACRALVELKECRFKDKCHYSHDKKLIEEARQEAGSIEVDDYFVEANCIEEACQSQSIAAQSIVAEKSKLKGKFRNPQGSPRSEPRENVATTPKTFCRNKTRSQDPPMSQDERSKSNPAVNDDHDDYDDGSIMIRPCPVRSEGTTAFSLITTEHGQPIFPLHSWCRAVPALVASKSLLESDGFKRDKWPWTCSASLDDDDRRILPKPSKEVALTISSKTRERSEPIPAVFDTGASAHCFPNTAFFIQAAVPNSFTSCHVVIKTARKGEVLVATKKADFLLRGLPDSPNSSILLRQALLADGVRRGLISAAKLTHDGYSLKFEKDHCTLSDHQGVKCMTVLRNHGSLYEVPNKYFARAPNPPAEESEEASLAQTYAEQSVELWHQRLGHCHVARLGGLFKEKGLKMKSEQDFNCIECTQAKMHHAAYPKTSDFRAEFPGQSFTVDFIGPFRVQSPFGHRYICMFVDVKSRHGYCVPAKLKSELSPLVDYYIAMVERVQQPNKTVTIVSDGALCDKDHLTSLRARGITVLIIAPGASRLNGIVERRNRTIEEGGRAMNIYAGLPPSFFIVACEYENAVQNMIPLTTTTLNRTQHAKTASDKLSAATKRNACPQEIWARRRLGSWDELLGHFRVFGCLAFALHRNPNKQVAKAERSIFLGMAPDNHNTYVLMSLETKTFSRFIQSRDVVCHECILPFKKAMELPAHIREHSITEHGALDSIPGAEETAAPELPAPLITPNEYSVEPNIEEIVDAPIENVTPQDEAERVNKKLSFAEVAVQKTVQFDLTRNERYSPAKLSGFDQRKQLGTGDASPAARSTPAHHLTVGQTYDTLLPDGRCTVREINKDGDLQVTFPDYANPNELFTLEKELIVDKAGKAEEAQVLEEQADGAMVRIGPLDAFAIETADGEIITSHEFTTTLLATEEALSAISRAVTRPPTAWSNRKTKTELGMRVIQPAALKLDDLVGKVLADTIVVPRTHYELKNNAIRPLVEDAQSAEIATLIRKNVFQNAHTALPSDQVIPTMFVNRAKGDAEGMLTKIKSRLTLRGDLDKPPAGTKRQTYAPVLLPNTLRILLSLHCADATVKFFQLDHEAAFVAAPSTRRIVVRLPPGHYGPGPKVPNAVHVTNFNLYGGDDAPLVYQNFMRERHLKMGFSGIMQDHCYLELHRGNDFIKFVVHVDDFLIAQRGEDLWQWYLTELKKDFQYTVAPLTFFVGMRFNRDAQTGSFKIDQEAQIDKMARAFDVKPSDKPLLTPILSFSEEDRPKLTDLPCTDAEKAAALLIPFRQGVGHLNYLAQCTYPEITLPTRIAASFMQAWGKKHWQWVKNVMLFLVSKSSKHFIISGSLEHRELSGWTDSDHAGNPDDRRSRSAHQIWLGNDLIDWYGRSQTIVAHSSAESELMALDACVRQMQHLRWLMESLNAPARGPSVINMDSSSALGMAENPIQNRRNRHIHARYFYVRDLINDKVVRLNKVDTDDNRADLLATYKDAATFKRLLGVCKPQPLD